MHEEKVAEKERYAAYLRMPEEEQLKFREEHGLKTKREVAEFCGISNALSYRVENGLGEGKSIREALDSPRFRKSLLDSIEKGLDKGNSKTVELALRLLDELNKKEVKVDLSPTERITVAREVINGLKEQYRLDGGRCPVCGEYKALCEEPCVDTKSEFAEGGEVADVELPDGFVGHNPILQRGLYPESQPIGDIVAGSNIS